MKKPVILGLTALLSLMALSAGAKEYRYISARQLKQDIEQQQPFLLVDIQAESEFTQHHIRGAIATSAYPVKTAEQRARLDSVLPQLKTSDNPVVLISPRAGIATERAYDYLLDNGVSLERMTILIGGQRQWPYPSLLASN